jgi:hypothetical protein
LYNFAWERSLGSRMSLQLGYVGSRAHKLLLMWYLNRAQPVPGIPQTTATWNERRPDRSVADIRWVLNGSRAYYDAVRASLQIQGMNGLTIDAGYWLSKSMDLGSSYTNTAFDGDSRISRSQAQDDQHVDMRGLSDFDQPHSFLLQASYLSPLDSRASWVGRLFGGWNLSAVLLAKSGTPFTVIAGSDAPGFGNVDGNGGDRPNLLDPSILGRTIGNPDTSQSLLPSDAFSFMEPTDPRGNLGRNTFRKGRIANINAALTRRWVLPSEMYFQFRAESINFLNTPQFADPGAEASNPNFGVITNTLNEGRTFRFRLDLGW